MLRRPRPYKGIVGIVKLILSPTNGPGGLGFPSPAVKDAIDLAMKVMQDNPSLV